MFLIDRFERYVAEVLEKHINIENVEKGDISYLTQPHKLGDLTKYSLLNGSESILVWIASRVSSSFKSAQEFALLNRCSQVLSTYENILDETQKEALKKNAELLERDLTVYFEKRTEELTLPKDKFGDDLVQPGDERYEDLNKERSADPNEVLQNIKKLAQQIGISSSNSNK